MQQYRNYRILLYLFVPPRLSPKRMIFFEMMCPSIKNKTGEHERHRQKADKEAACISHHFRFHLSHNVNKNFCRALWGRTIAAILYASRAERALCAAATICIPTSTACFSKRVPCHNSPKYAPHCVPLIYIAVSRDWHNARL